MSNDEPGAGREGGEPEKRPPGGQDNPFAGFDLGAIFGQLQSMFSWQGGPINWNLAKETARQTIREAGDASLTGAERAAVDQTVRLAEHWLDEATTLPAGSAGAALAWNRSDWLEGTLPAWQKLVEPLATHVVGAMEKALPEQPGPMGTPLTGVLTQVGGMMFGAQVGQGLGQLATEVFGATDVGLPLGPAGQPVLLPANVAKFGEGLGLPAEDVRLYLVLRECAHQRLFHHAPWLSAHLFSAVEDYARGMHVDVRKLEDAVGQIDMTNPEALQEALGGGLFEPEETPRQKAALARLETALALVEGWVDDVVTVAAAPRMPSAVQLHEAVRRRRAEGGPAEQTFGTLVGLELRPRRMRDAATLWAALREEHGITARESLWAHPDLLPSGDDLDDPRGFAAHAGAPESLDLGDLGFDLPGEPGTPGTPDEPGTPGDKPAGESGDDGPAR
ncbi:zinc-dependent metalloprotease [Actinopolymorpha alba]|uniref:zinc-dependent metalloprotease n=1 Tax=Actinopolymorpha alba TaxID=533267 RepID=UPI0003675F5B|nr:zinc-dependent metalloprotease [Actinopolymorpha alba]